MSCGGLGCAGTYFRNNRRWPISGIGAATFFMNALEALDDTRQSWLQIWLQNWLQWREGVEAGRTLPEAIEELEKLAQERGKITEIETIKAWLILAVDTNI
jgi:hypothetical protein